MVCCVAVCIKDHGTGSLYTLSLSPVRSELDRKDENEEQKRMGKIELGKEGSNIGTGMGRVKDLT